MTERPAGLLLRVDPADQDLRLLRQALACALLDCPDASFSTLFVDDRPGIHEWAAAALRQELEQGGRLEAGAEITWHGPPDPARSGNPWGASRRSLSRVPKTGWPAGPLGVVLGPRDLAATDRPEQLRRMRERGVFHLSLLHGPAAAADAVRRFAVAAQACGFSRYEAANGAVSGPEAGWLCDARAGGAIMAIGPGTYGRWRAGAGWHWWRAGPAARWRAAVRAGGSGRGRLHALSARERAVERLIDGLRLADGVDVAAIEQETARPCGQWLDLAGLKLAMDGGLLRRIGHRLVATDLDRSDDLAKMLLLPAGGAPAGA